MNWTIDTELSDHYMLKHGITCLFVSRVQLSAVDFPDPVDALACAALLSMSVHGRMATRATHCL